MIRLPFVQEAGELETNPLGRGFASSRSNIGLIQHWVDPLPSPIQWTTHDADVDLVAGRGRRLTGHGHRVLQGQVLHHVQVPELLTHLLHRQALDTEQGTHYVRETHTQRRKRTFTATP